MKKKKTNKKDNLSLSEIDNKIAELNIQKMLELEKSLKSDNANDILKAQSYISAVNSNRNQHKAYLFDPFSAVVDGNGYKQKNNNISFDLLKRVSKIPIIKTVHQTRIFQVQNFLKFQTDDQKEGFTIRRKLSRFEDVSNKVTDEDRRVIEYIADFIENSRKPVKKKSNGINFDAAKWDEFDDFDDFVRLILNDTYTFDQIAVENVRSRRFELLSYKAIDASTVRYLDTIDRRFKSSTMYDNDRVNGFLPKFGQVYNGQLLNDQYTNQPIVWYPWELSFGIRNRSTDIYSNNYGISELEILIDVISYFLYGFNYNGNFFKNGSNPKGFLNIKGEANTNAVESFKQMWRSMVGGAGNEHKIPMFEGTEVNWVRMQENNRDMEFHKWIEFLIVMICSVYCIDPSEMGFNFEGSSRMFGQDGQKERLNHSKNKGLKPMLSFLQKFISKYIVSEINPDFEFVFTGVDLEDASTVLDNDIKKVGAGAISLEDFFKKYSDRELTDKDTILNNIAFQYKQAKQYGGMQENEMVDKAFGGKDVGARNPMESIVEDNPITNESMEYINNMF